jgi:hypothetical protein
MKKRLLIFIVVSLMALSSFTILKCVGGGTPPEVEPQGSSNWDEMVWDKDNWD